MIFRHCHSKLPQHLWELQDGPRHGGYNRIGFEAAPDAAGHPFPKGAPSCHVLFDGRPFPQGEPNVDGFQHKRKDLVTSFDHTGAAGCGSPRTEVRAFTVDDHARRARSEPPQSDASCAVQLLAMQNFSVFPGIDSQVRGRLRCLSPELSLACRSEVGKRALKFGDITDIPTKKSFCGAPSPGISSPRLAAVALESLDIDARAGRAHLVDTPAEGILPTNKPSLGLECRHDPLSAGPRRKDMRYFDNKLEADRYAKLIGRPQAATNKELQRMRLKLEAEVYDTLFGQPHAAPSKELQRVRLALGLEKCEIATQDVQYSNGSTATPSEVSVDASPSGSSTQEFESEPRLSHSMQSSEQECKALVLDGWHVVKPSQSSTKDFDSQPVVSWEEEARPQQIIAPLDVQRRDVQGKCDDGGFDGRLALSIRTERAATWKAPGLQLADHRGLQCPNSPSRDASPMSPMSPKMEAWPQSTKTCRASRHAKKSDNQAPNSKCGRSLPKRAVSRTP